MGSNSRDAEVWVYMQQQDLDLAEASLEVLGKACELASRLKTGVAGILAGHKVDVLAEKVLLYGAQKVYVLQSRHLEHYSAAMYAKAFCRLISSRKPAVFLAAATLQGRDLAPRIASALQVGLTANCTDLKIGSCIDPATRREYTDILLQLRPAWGGTNMATIISPEARPQMATVREGAMKAALPVHGPRGDIIHIPPDVHAEDSLTTVLERLPAENRVHLKDAGIIIAGGAGMGSKKNFDQLHRLAAVLGGQVAGTRAAVDAGFIGPERMIGQTGACVRPRLYIACGISGAAQHLAGMLQSGTIIAVNTDPGAPIFSLAHYGIVGDALEVTPKLITAYKQLRH